MAVEAGATWSSRLRASSVSHSGVHIVRITPPHALAGSCGNRAAGPRRVYKAFQATVRTAVSK